MIKIQRLVVTSSKHFRSHLRLYLASFTCDLLTHLNTRCKQDKGNSKQEKGMRYIKIHNDVMMQIA